MLCRVESTDRGQRDAKAGPVSLVRATTSPASFHGYCLGRLQAFAAEVEQLGPLATDEERRIAAMARASGAEPDHTACPSWTAERDNRDARKLVDQPNTRRRVLEAPRAA